MTCLYGHALCLTAEVAGRDVDVTQALKLGDGEMTIDFHRFLDLIAADRRQSPMREEIADLVSRVRTLEQAVACNAFERKR